LHSYFVQTSKNRYFIDFFEVQVPYFLIFFGWESLSDEILASVAEQHRAILEPLLADKLTEARRALSHHIRYSHPVLRDAIVRLRAGEILTGTTRRKAAQLS
jgi:DNA-binding GntR family transcriptional regulator